MEVEQVYGLLHVVVRSESFFSWLSDVKMARTLVHVPIYSGVFQVTWRRYPRGTAVRNTALTYPTYIFISPIAPVFFVVRVRHS